MTILLSNIGIYKITSPTNKIYIGQSIHLRKRESRYRNGYCESQTILYRSILKHGWDNHTFEVIKHFPINVLPKELDDCEIYYIKFYKDSGYKLLNIREGGKKAKQSPESIAKMLETRGKWNHTEESKLKIRNSQLGKWHHTDETKLKLSNLSKGRKLTESQKLKQSETLKRKYCNNDSPLFEMCENNKKLILNFETGIFYKGAEEASFAYNLNINTLRKKLRGVELRNNTNLKYV